MRLAKKAGVEKPGLGNWIAFDLTKIGAPGGATLTEVFRAIVKRSEWLRQRGKARTNFQTASLAES